jgi:transposase InsO family protein
MGGTKRHNPGLHRTRPADAEWFHRTLRGVLDMHVFRNLTEVREQAELWLADYNREIPHDSLGGLTPAEFRQQNDPATAGYGWH